LTARAVQSAERCNNKSRNRPLTPEHTQQILRLQSAPKVEALQGV
jgi:hypothetical protein